MNRPIARRCMAWILAAATALCLASGLADAELPQLQMNEEITVTIRNEDEQVSYAFTPPATGSYTLASGGDMDASVEVYGPDGSLLDADDDSGTRLNFELACRLEAGKTYRCAFGASSFYEPGSYVVQLTETADTSAERTVLRADAITAVDFSGSLLDRKWFAFAPEASGTYELRVDTPIRLECDIYEENDSAALREEVIGGNAGPAVVAMNAGVTYLIRLSPLSGDRVSAGVSIVRTAEPADGGELTLGRTVVADAMTQGRVTRYAFTPEETGSYTIYAMGDYDTCVSLYRADTGELLARNDDREADSNFLLTAELNAGETYWFDAQIRDTIMTGTFEVCLVAGTEMAAPAPAEDAERIEPGTARTVEIEQAGRKMTFVFTAETEGTYRLWSTGDLDTFVTGHGPGESDTFANDDGGEGVNFSVSFTAHAGDTFWFETSLLAGGMTGSFTVELERVPDRASGGNDGPADGEAEDIVPGVPAGVSFPTGGMRKTFRFAPEEDGTYYVTSDSVPDTYVRAYRSDGWEAADDDGGEGTNFGLTFQARAGEVYLIEVRFLTDTATGTFTVHLSRTGDLPVPGAVYGDHPVTLRTGEDVEITVTGADDKAILLFTPGYTDVYTLRSVSACDPYVNLYEGEAINAIGYDDDGGLSTAGDFRLSYELEAGVTYRYEVQLWPYAGFGTFTVRLDWDASPDDP